MDDVIFGTAGSGPIRLDGEVTARAAAGLHARLVAALQAGHPLTVDTSASETVHVAILQVLVAADIAARTQNLPFSLIAPPDGACRTAFARAGLAVPGTGV